MKLIRFLLFPLSLAYYFVTSIRNFLFDAGILKSTSFKIPTIVVGNLSVGGTGKTPQIEYLVQLFKKDFKLAVLSRGYGRKTKGFIKATSLSTAKEIGDEPLQFYKKFNDIAVAVDENRVNGINKLLRDEDKPSLVLLDDAFQHRKIKAGFYILLTKYEDLFVDDFLLPTGNLRESAHGANRADIVIVTKCPTTISLFNQHEIKKKLTQNFQGPVFFTSISYSEALKSNTQSEMTLSDLKNYEVLLVTGIANPSPLLDFLKANKLLFHHIKYPDHHLFSNADVEKIKQDFAAISSDKKIILTTEKDFVRLENRLTDLYYIEIATKFINKKEDFDSMLKEYVAARSKFL